MLLQWRVTSNRSAASSCALVSLSVHELQRTCSKNHELRIERFCRDFHFFLNKIPFQHSPMLTKLYFTLIGTKKAFILPSLNLRKSNNFCPHFISCYSSIFNPLTNFYAMFRLNRMVQNGTELPSHCLGIFIFMLELEKKHLFVRVAPRRERKRGVLNGMEFIPSSLILFHSSLNDPNIGTHYDSFPSFSINLNLSFGFIVAPLCSPNRAAFPLSCTSPLITKVQERG